MLFAYLRVDGVDEIASARADSQARVDEAHDAWQIDDLYGRQRK